MEFDRLEARFAELRDANRRFKEAHDAWRATGIEGWRDSMIKRFEFTFELSWKTAQTWLSRYEADIIPYGPRQVFELAFARGLIDDANAWSVMHKDRNTTVHVYGELKIADIAERIAALAPGLFDGLIERLAQRPD